jgi:hypothetical protein
MFETIQPLSIGGLKQLLIHLNVSQFNYASFKCSKNEELDSPLKDFRALSWNQITYSRRSDTPVTCEELVAMIDNLNQQILEIYLSCDESSIVIDIVGNSLKFNKKKLNKKKPNVDLAAIMNMGLRHIEFNN